MMTLINLFGRSPFAPLARHMEEVAICVHLLDDLFNALVAEDYQKLEEISQKISKQEHKADLTKNDIRNHLPKSLFLPIDRGNLLDILKLQDHIADAAEDVAVLANLKPLVVIDLFKDELKDFLQKNIATFNGTQEIIKELHELLESSFGGIEAEKVRKMVHQVAYQEHETDLSQRKLLKKLLMSEDHLSYTAFYLWQKIFEVLGSISNLSESLAYRVRMTLELK